jgi:DNA-binding GntR family transcriptional regulator
MALRHTGTSLGKVEKATLQDRIYQQLREALITGDFEPGETLPIARLTETFGTSPMPAREAVHRLIAEGALQSEPNKLTRVPWLSLEHFTNLCQARSLLEGWAAEEAARVCTKAQLDELDMLHKDLRKSVMLGDVAPILRINRDFHFNLYGLCANPVLLKTIESYWVQSGPYVRAIQNNRSLHNEAKDGDALAPHRTLLKALGSHDAQSAGNAIRLDIQNSVEWYERLLSHEAQAPA